MRPKKRILLCSGDELRASTVRFMLTTRGYAVTAALDATDALAHLAISQWDLVLCDLPLAGAKLIADRAHKCFYPTPTLLIIGKLDPVPQDVVADAIQLRDAGAAELLDRIKVVSARKRGPRKGTKKPVMSVRVQIIEGELVGVA